MTVDLFVPCFIDQLFPGIGFDVIKTLEKANVSVKYNPKQTCCGQPFYNGGHWNHSRKLAEKFLSDFSGNIPIIVPSASCAGFIRNHFKILFEDSQSTMKEIERISGNIIEYTDFLVNHLNYTNFNSEFPHKVTYHDGCSALREYGIEKEPRILLDKVKQLELKEMEHNTTCCGFGGTFMMKFTAISTAMAEQKVRNALKTGASFIISSEASCLININSYIEKQRLPIKTIHIANVLARF